MNDDYGFLDYLNSLYPVSSVFREKMSKILPVLDYPDASAFQKINDPTEKAWWLVEGYIVAIEKKSTGEEEVVKIFYPGWFVTILDSFTKAEPSKLKLISIGPVKVEELNGAEFFKLKIYRETNELLTKISLIYTDRLKQRLEILLLPIPERVKAFVIHYPVAGLADEFAASWLKISVAAYREQLEALSKAEIEMKRASVWDSVPPSALNLAKRAEIYIKAHYATHELTTLRSIAMAFSVSEDTVIRRFKKEFGKSVAAYTREYRMSRAKAMLLEGRKVFDIAEALGYQNEYNFRRDFKNFFQLTPSQVVKSSASGDIK